MSRLIAFQGERGAFGEEAVAAVWPNEAEPIPMSTFAAVVHAVADGRVAAGVLPVENAIAGAVHESVDALNASTGVRVVGETVVPITQCLMAPEGASIEMLRSIESHPAALAQCRVFLRRYPRIGVVPVADTAGAARVVAAANDVRRAAIAGRGAAARYGLSILAEGIQDTSDNSTRFVIIAPAVPVRQLLSARWRRFHAVRGATAVDADDPGWIREATRELLRALLQRNAVTGEHVVSALFSTTNDLTSDFPARAARDLGWTDTPLMCMSEIPVPGALARCIRVMLHVELEHPRAAMSPVYLRGAETLRLDLRQQPAEMHDKGVIGEGEERDR
ncbi:MAG: chorismate mutase [Gemmatimonadaceae bacterium]